ncbi:MAG: choice-of-anchor Q domain-containing protein, partial [Cyanobacteria bacterium P01_G01_bin.54]
ASLATGTGLDVAASTNATGSANHSGDWLLESSTGSIETQNPFTDETLANWDGKLATFTVENGNDSGADSLRDEISNANGSAGADEIRFANGVTLVDLTSGELSITEELTITGGSTNVTVQRNAGAADFRIFDVTGGATTTFDNLTITNGKTTDTGGGIDSNGAVNLINTTVTGNSSTDRGGGIYNLNQAITLTNSTVSGNSTNQYGGGVATRSTITLTNSTVANNSSRRNGGGLYSRSGNITLTDSTVSSNSSNRHGGGVWARSRTITLTNSTVTGNSSRLSAAGTYSQTIHMTDSVVSNNTSGDLGGGVYFTGTGTITDSTISGNSSASKGGGMYFRNNLTITNSTFSDNVSNRGGSIYSRGGGTVNIINTTISGNSSSDRGGGLFARGNGGGTITLLNSTVADNTSGNNGGGLFRNGGTVNLTNTIVASNTASGSGNDLSGTFNTIQNSLIGDTAGATITTSTHNLTDLDPGLLALGDYGGDTQTHALRPESVAINAGSNALTTVTTDQRGVSRSFEGTVDIGAYESHGFSLAAITTDRDTTPNTTSFDVSVQVVEDAFATAIPLDGLSVNYALSNGAVFGSFSNGTTVVTDARGIAVNVFDLTGFESYLNGIVQVLASPINLTSFVQQVAGTTITINRFEHNLGIGFDCRFIQVGDSIGHSTACTSLIDNQPIDNGEDDTDLITHEVDDGRSH